MRRSSQWARLSAAALGGISPASVPTGCGSDRTEHTGDSGGRVPSLRGMEEVALNCRTSSRSPAPPQTARGIGLTPATLYLRERWRHRGQRFPQKLDLILSNPPHRLPPTSLSLGRWRRWSLAGSQGPALPGTQQR